MNVLFLGLLYNRNDEKELIKKSKTGLQAAINEYQWNFIDALDYSKLKIDILNVLPVGTFPRKYNQLFIKSKKWKYKNNDCIQIGSINLPVFKEFIRKNKIKKYLKQYISEHKNAKIILYSLYLPFLRAISELKQKGYNFEVITIIPDLPGKYGIYSKNKIYKLYQDYSQITSFKLLKNVDKFILLTEHMNKIVNSDNKPYCIVEGIAKDIQHNSNKKNKIIYFYAGTLNKQYGLEEFINEFVDINNSSTELWIAGRGELEEYVKKMSIAYTNIKYFGFLPKEEVLEKEIQATILVNPRKNEGEYTKYSFPSKILEYMATGTTILMNKLDGIPYEYYENVLLFDVSINKTLSEINAMPIEKIEEVGKKAKQWIINNKEVKSISEKICNFIEMDCK